MPKVSSTYGVQEVSGALVGLELEIEGERLPVVEEESVWVCVRDGSLRNGLEYIFKAPMGSVRTKAALLEMEGLMEKFNTKTSYSFRTSTHVHINVSNLDVDIAKIMVYLYYQFEDEYSRFCAKHRQANRFCLGMKDASTIIYQLTSFFRTSRLPDQESSKYSALNLFTLSKYGTLEFRMLEGSNNWARIYTWVRVLLALRKAAKDIGTFKNLVTLTSQEMADKLFPTPRLKSQFLLEGWEDRVAMNKSIGIMAFEEIHKKAANATNSSV